MFTLGKFVLLTQDEFEDEFFQSNAVIEAHEKQIKNIQTTLDNLRVESTKIHQELLASQEVAARVPVLEAEKLELEKEVLQLQKVLANPLSPTGETPVKKVARRKVIATKRQ